MNWVLRYSHIKMGTWALCKTRRHPKQTHTKLHTVLPREQLGCRAVFRGRQVMVRRHINCHFLLCQRSNSLLKVWPLTPSSPADWAARRRSRKVITNDSAVKGGLQRHFRPGPFTPLQQVKDVSKSITNCRHAASQVFVLGWKFLYMSV